MSAASPVVAVVGLGYVGLPLALHFAEASTRVVGLDIDPSKVARLSAGESYISHLPASRIRAASAKGLFMAATDFDLLREADAVDASAGAGPVLCDGNGRGGGRAP